MMPTAELTTLMWGLANALRNSPPSERRDYKARGKYFLGGSRNPAFETPCRAGGDDRRTRASTLAPGTPFLQVFRVVGITALLGCTVRRREWSDWESRQGRLSREVTVESRGQRPRYNFTVGGRESFRRSRESRRSATNRKTGN